MEHNDNQTTDLDSKGWPSHAEDPTDQEHQAGGKTTSKIVNKESKVVVGVKGVCGATFNITKAICTEIVGRLNVELDKGAYYPCQDKANTQTWENHCCVPKLVIALFLGWCS
eukprot:GFUD01014041.1.p2 GENE.GFUD01014041.1~~GFUD01014041.1.p2  ORF type:complete len:112 (+),score=22.63 GFUD01014041.1:211-546(+)